MWCKDFVPTFPIHGAKFSKSWEAHCLCSRSFLHPHTLQVKHGLQGYTTQSGFFASIFSVLWYPACHGASFSIQWEVMLLPCVPLRVHRRNSYMYYKGLQSRLTMAAWGVTDRTKWAVCALGSQRQPSRVRGLELTAKSDVRLAKP